MANGSQLIESLYTRLVLRDLFGKVLPGSLVLVGAYVAFLSDAPSPTRTILRLAEAPFGLWAILVPLAWLTSFAIQAAGELFGLIRYYPKRVESQAEVASQLAEFMSKATPAERQVHERLVVIKEACGNGYLALLVTAVCMAARFHQPRHSALAGAVLVAAIFLRWLHRRQVDRQKDWRDAVVKLHTPGQPSEHVGGT